MLAKARNFLTSHFHQPENELMQIILINGLVFITWLLIKTALVLAGYKAYYPALSAPAPTCFLGACLCSLNMAHQPNY